MTHDVQTRHRPLGERQEHATRRARKDALMRGLLLAAVATALIPLASILVVTAMRGLDAFGWDFITQTAPFNPTEQGGGYLHGFVGSLAMVGIAILLAVPLGIAAALYLAEFGDGPLVRPIRFFTDVMTGVPSIFVGVFVYSAFVVDAGFFYGTLPGGIALAILMLPIVVRSAEEILRLVPDDLRNAAYALGSRRWQSALKIVIPAAGPGLITGAMLAVARAMGETAPLLFTALGANRVILELTGKPQTSLTLLAFDDARTFAEAANARGWAGAFALIALTLILTVVARVIGSRGSVQAN